MASIREIAARAQVAPGTVSRTLNNKGYISKETREKVEKALKELEAVRSSEFDFRTLFS